MSLGPDAPGPDRPDLDGLDLDGPALDGAWAAALAGALVGAARAPQAGSEAGSEAGPGTAGALAIPASGDPGADLLARLGALAACRSAGAGLAAGRLAPFTPFDPPGPSYRDCPAAAGARLARLLAEGAAAEPLVEEWCALAAERGCRAPPELWPLLDLRSTTTAAAAGAAAVARVAGAEIAWLRRAFAGEGGAPTGEAGGDAEDWTLGPLPERRRLFAAMRAADPGGARDALAAAFRSEKAEARAAFVEAMEEGLGGADEPFLEACLDDRSAAVRGAAQRLLVRLPDSRLAGRMAERAAAALRVTTERRPPGGPRHVLDVTLPEPSPELARDGVEPRHGAGGGGAAGIGAGLLRGVLASAPLRAHAAHPPALWLSLAAGSEWRPQLLPAFVEAVRRERDPAWIEAALSTLGRLCAERRADGDRLILPIFGGLTTVLPADLWEERAEAAMRSKDVGLARGLLTVGAGPHSPSFTRAVLAWLGDLLRRGGPDRDGLRDHPVMRMLPRRLDPGGAAAAARLLDLVPEEDDPRLHRALVGLADTLAQRAAMRREFDA